MLGDIYKFSCRNYLAKNVSVKLEIGAQSRDMSCPTHSRRGYGTRDGGGGGIVEIGGTRQLGIESPRFSCRVRVKMR